VLEDEPSTMLLITEILKAEGYRVTESNSGSDALRKARSLKPDLILSDLGVPGLDGYQFCKMLRLGNVHEGPIVVLSGRTTPDDVDHALECGASEFVGKPVDREKLLAAVSKQLAPPEPADTEDPRPHVLVVEDEPATLNLLKKMLEDAGYRVTGAPDGARALTAARTDPDAVITDLVVPGIDGFQLIQTLCARKEFTAPIIVVSGRTRDEDVERAKTAGARVFLSKPVVRKNLLSTLADQLGDRAPGKNSETPKE
jgi:DNA-binding response OmpR family regulator